MYLFIRNIESPRYYASLKHQFILYAYKKQPFEHKTFLKLHTMTIGQHFLAILCALAVDKRHKE